MPIIATHRRRSLVIAVAAIVSSSQLSNNAAAEDVAGPWSPYRTALIVVADNSPQLTPSCLADVAADLRRSLQTTAGAAWTISAVDAEQVPTALLSAARVASAASPEIAPAAPHGEFDKHIFCTLRHDGHAYRILVREWDTACRSLGPATMASAVQRELIADAALAAVCRAFRLLAKVEPAESGKMRLSVKAGGLLSDAAWPLLARQGDAFVPLLRARRRDGDYERARPIPWTLLELIDVQRADSGPPVVLCEVRSGVNNPLASRRRGRHEAWALAAGRPDGETTLVVQSQSDKKPVADCEIFAVGPEKQTRSLGRTNVEGKLSVTSTDAHPLRLIVAGRYLPLAQLPLLPGLEPEVTVPIAADGRLRGTEDWLTDWQTEFLDLYVRRRALMAAASVMIERGEKPAATRLLDQVDRLGSPAERIQSLEIRRRTAASGGDPAASKIIDQLFAKVLATVRQLDDAAALVDLRRRLGG
ncbi:MAG: hypothetical protein J0M17_13650 [Planctomycetes bacterium]|nr:hypothetical protein [Planctomycetota bacterium]